MIDSVIRVHGEGSFNFLVNYWVCMYACMWVVTAVALVPIKEHVLD